MKKNKTQILKYWLLFVFMISFNSLFAQEYEVVGFDMDVKDLTAKTNSRIDSNGRKCAVIKIYVDDQIVEARGNVIGDVVSTGMEKIIYMGHDAKSVELIFAHHYPMKIVFEDHDYPTITSQMTYIMKLRNKANDYQASRQETPPNQSAKQDNQSVAATTTPQKEDNPARIEEIREKAKSEYSNGNYAKALELFKTIPDDAVAQCYIGVMYNFGQGVSQDYYEAVKWYRKAAEQGDPIAQNNMGVMYLRGQGVTQDHYEAVKWISKAAEQGYATAQNNLGYMYKEGDGVYQDYSKAVKWYRKAANQGYAAAQRHLGNMYYHGYGVHQNYSKAMKWYRKAVDQGDEDAQWYLGFMHYNGYGAERDLEKAKEYWTEAAKKGDQTAIDDLKKYFNLTISNN